jgi:UPF0716 protein FxsA
MRLFLFIAFVIVPIIEIALFLQVGSLIGVPATLGLIIATAAVGTMLVRSQGLDAIRKIQTSANQGEMPVAAILQGFCVLVAGILLLTPGFATDTLGFSLLIPPIRSLIASMLWKIIEPGIVSTTSWSTGPGNHGGGSVIIEGEAVEIDDDPTRDVKNPTGALPPK